MANEQTIANLIVKLSSDISALTPGLKKAEAEVKSFSSNITSGVASIAAGLAAAIGAVAGYSLMKSISEAKDYAVQIAETAEKAGVSTEFLSRMAEAADDVGVSIGSLATGIKFLSKNMMEASQGIGDQRSVFNALKVEYESAPGVLRGVEDMMLDLADVFSKMEDGPAKTAMALKLLGRSGTDMIPYLNQGRAALEKVMRASDAAGTTISASLGARSRELKRDLGDVTDALRGISLTVLSELMPAIQSAAKFILGVAESMNRLRGHAGLVSEVLRYTAAVVLPLVVVQLGSMVSAVGLANIAVRAFGATLAFLSGPVGLITVALTALSVLWVKLGEGTRKAAKDHMEYVAAVSSLKPEDLQKGLVTMTDYLAMIQKKIAEAKEKIGDATPSRAQGMALDELLKFEAEAKARIAAIQKLQEAVTQKKTPAPFVPDPKILQTLTDKARELGAAFAAFQDPVAGASAAVEEFIRKTIGTAPVTDALKKAANDVRAAFQTLFKAQQARANLAAAEKGTFAVSVAGWEAYGQDLQRQFDNGLIDIKTYYQERRNLINAQNAAEILLLQTEKGRKETTPARRIEIDAEIKVKGIKQDATIAADLAAETAAWRTLGEASLDFEQRLAEAQGRVLEGKRAALALEMQAYEVGLRGRGVSAAEAKKQADELFAAKTTEIDFNEQIRLFSIEMADLDIRKQKIQDDLAVGIGNQATAEEKILELERQRIPVLKAMADEAARLADESGRPELVQQAQGLDGAVRKLSVSTDESGRQMADLKKGAEDALVDGFANFLSQGITGAKNFGEAVKNMAASFAQAMAKMLAQVIAMAAVKAALRAFGFSEGGEVSLDSVTTTLATENAAGGYIRGPGTDTSDSILARLSNNEYVVRAKAVRHYGVSVLESINRMVLPRGAFAGAGGMMPHSPGFAFATGGLAQGGGGGGGTTLDSSLTVGLDQGLILKALDTPAGQKVFVKILEKNKRSVRSAIGG